jgi:hypothetical protein
MLSGWFWVRVPVNPFAILQAWFSRETAARAGCRAVDAIRAEAFASAVKMINLARKTWKTAT